MIDGPVITKKFKDDKKAIVYLDENTYKKQERVIRKYFMGSYKWLVFEFYLNQIQKLPEGKHAIDLKASKLFEKVYGKLELHLEVKNKAIVLIGFTPLEIIDACHKRELPAYKGIPIRDKNDIKKIKIIQALERD